MQARAAAVMSLLSVAAAGASLGLAESHGAGTPAHAMVTTLLLCLVGGVVIFNGLSGAAYPHARLGLCNSLTMTRAAGIAAMAGLLATPDALAVLSGTGWTLVILAGAVLALDAVDGWAARQSGLKSEFGARFDVEVDVVFAIVMAALAWQAGKVGAWFLMLGALRPAFLLARAVWPRLRGALPDARWRKTVAAIQMAVQVALLAPLLAPPVSQLVAATLLAALVGSFSVDIRWLLTRSRGRS